MGLNYSTRIRLFLTMKQRLYRDALLSELVNQEDIDFVGESSSGTETLKLLVRCSPSVLIIEEDLRDNDGLTISEIALAQDPSLTVILLVDSDISQKRLAIYLDSGIKSVVSKTQAMQDLSKTLNYTRNGQVYIDAEHYRSTQGSSMEKSKRIDVERYCSLSAREQEVASCMAERIPVMKIAEQLGVSHKTIHTYKERILIKLGFRRLPELILFMKRIQFHELENETP